MENNYFVPAHDHVCEFIEKKSRFISYLAHVTTEDEAAEFIESVRKKHSDATHNCIAYRLYNPRIERFSDDGEPSGTAGMPMLEVLKKENVYDICVVVTRYFGGVLLGAGGLVRAYAKGSADALAGAGKAVREMGVRVCFLFGYPSYDRIQKLLESYSFNAIDTRFGEMVELELCVKQADFDSICKNVTDITGASAKITEIAHYFDSFK